MYWSERRRGAEPLREKLPEDQRKVEGQRKA